MGNKGTHIKNSLLIKGAEPFAFGQGTHAILFIHGWTSSPRELRFLAESLSTLYYCRGILLNGHGLTAEALEDTNWQGHLNQVLEVLENLHSQFKKVSIIGLSYGAVLALHAAARRPVSNLILLSPFIKSAEYVIKRIPKSSFVRFIPPFIKNIPKKSDGPINKKSELKKHIMYDKMPVKPLKSVINCIQNVYGIIPSLSSPTLLLHSKEDKTASFEGSEYILKHIDSKDKTLIPLTESNHIITLDYDKERVTREISTWLKQRS